MRRYLVCELEQVIGHACHRRDDRHDLTALALCFKESARDLADSLRRPNGSATIFLNYQRHVRLRLIRRKHEARSFSSVGYSPIAHRTSFTVAATGFNSSIRWRIASGSFKPCPVTVQTMRLASGIFWNEYTVSCESQHLKSPAIAAALAGSTKIRSRPASQLWAATISS